MLITGQTENTKRTDQTQDFDDYGKQEAKKQDIDYFEKPIINQHYTGLSRAMHSCYDF